MLRRRGRTRRGEGLLISALSMADRQTQSASRIEQAVMPGNLLTALAGRKGTLRDPLVGVESGPQHLHFKKPAVPCVGSSAEVGGVSDNALVPASLGSPCVEWPLSRSARGYGKLRERRTGKTRSAHRVVWEQEQGPIPKGMCVCHRCDNPPCINIEHLFLGTQADNMADMKRKNRSGLGERYNSKKTQCPHGHTYTAENTRLYRGKRYCRECNNSKRYR